MPKLQLSEKGREKVRKTVKTTIRSRKRKMRQAAKYLEKWDRESRESICVACGEFMKECLDDHHPHGKAKKPHYTVILCASCHRIFDKNGGLNELKIRRKRY